RDCSYEIGPLTSNIRKLTGEKSSGKALDAMSSGVILCSHRERVTRCVLTRVVGANNYSPVAIRGL
ncbi:MAG: hypothetical protein KKC50_02485, partial [Candidatus Omnitrophica bacterium]|nr:hypothetical protein [Candidatus Omnitrophota bacterium]